MEAELHQKEDTLSIDSKPTEASADLTLSSKKHVVVSQVLAETKEEELISKDIPKKAVADFTVSSKEHIIVTETQFQTSEKTLTTEKTPTPVTVGYTLPTEEYIEISQIEPHTHEFELELDKKPKEEIAGVTIPTELHFEISEIESHLKPEDIVPEKIPRSVKADVTVPTIEHVIISETETNLQVKEFASTKPSIDKAKQTLAVKEPIKIDEIPGEVSIEQQVTLTKKIEKPKKKDADQSFADIVLEEAAEFVVQKPLSKTADIIEDVSSFTIENEKVKETKRKSITEQFSPFTVTLPEEENITEESSDASVTKKRTVKVVHKKTKDGKIIEVKEIVETFSSASFEKTKPTIEDVTETEEEVFQSETGKQPVIEEVEELTPAIVDVSETPEEISAVVEEIPYEKTDESVITLKKKPKRKVETEPTVRDESSGDDSDGTVIKLKKKRSIVEEIEIIPAPKVDVEDKEQIISIPHVETMKDNVEILIEESEDVLPKTEARVKKEGPEVFISEITETKTEIPIIPLDDVKRKDITDSAKITLKKGKKPVTEITMPKSKEETSTSESLEIVIKEKPIDEKEETTQIKLKPKKKPQGTETSEVEIIKPKELSETTETISFEVESEKPEDSKVESIEIKLKPSEVEEHKSVCKLPEDETTETSISLKKKPQDTNEETIKIKKKPKAVEESRVISELQEEETKITTISLKSKPEHSETETVEIKKKPREVEETKPLSELLEEETTDTYISLKKKPDDFKEETVKIKKKPKEVVETKPVSEIPKEETTVTSISLKKKAKPSETETTDVKIKPKEIEESKPEEETAETSISLKKRAEDTKVETVKIKKKPKEVDEIKPVTKVPEEETTITSVSLKKKPEPSETETVDIKIAPKEVKGPTPEEETAETSISLKKKPEDTKVETLKLKKKPKEVEETKLISERPEEETEITSVSLKKKPEHSETETVAIKIKPKEVEETKPEEETAETSISLKKKPEDTKIETVKLKKKPKEVEETKPVSETPEEETEITSVSLKKKPEHSETETVAIKIKPKEVEETKPEEETEETHISLKKKLKVVEEAKIVSKVPEEEITETSISLKKKSTKVVSETQEESITLKPVTEKFTQEETECVEISIKKTEAESLIAPEELEITPKIFDSVKPSKQIIEKVPEPSAVKTTEPSDKVEETISLKKKKTSPEIPKEESETITHEILQIQKHEMQEVEMSFSKVEDTILTKHGVMVSETADTIFLKQSLSDEKEPLSAAVEDVKEALEKKPSLSEEPTKVIEEVSEKAVLKIKKKPKHEEKPVEAVIATKEEELPEEVTESAVLKLKKKPKEKEEPVEAVIETQRIEETKVEEVTEKAVLKLKKKIKEEEQPVEAVTIEKVPSKEEKVTEDVAESAVIKIKKKPKEEELSETVVEQNLSLSAKKIISETAEISEVVKIKKEVKLEEPKKRKPSIKTAEEGEDKFEPEKAAEFPTKPTAVEKADERLVKLETGENIQQISEINVLKSEKKPTEEVKTAKIKLKKKPTVKEEEPVVEEFKIGLKPEKPEETISEDTEETFSLNIQKPKDTVVEEETVEMVISQPKEMKYSVIEEKADLKIKKQVIIEEPTPLQSKIEEIPETIEKVKIKRKPKIEEPVSEEIKIIKKPVDETDKEEVTEEFKVELPSKSAPKEIIEETSFKLETEIKHVETQVIEQKAELTVKKYVEEVAPEEPKGIEEVLKQKSPEKEETKPIDEKVKIKRKPKIKDEPASDVVQMSLKPVEKEPEKTEEVQESFKIELPSKPEQREETVEEATVKLSVKNLEEEKFHVVEETAEVTVKKVVETPEEEETVKTTIVKKKKPKKPEEPQAVDFKIPERPEEKPKEIEDVEEVFELKIKPKDEELSVVEETAELVVLKPEKPKHITVTEENAEITVKKKVEVEETTEKVVFKKKKTPKVQETPDTESKLPLQDKTPLEPEQIEEVEEAFTFKPKRKEEKAVHIEEVEEVLKLPVVTEKKDFSITEENAEITVKKKVEVEETTEKVVFKKKKTPKVQETPDTEFKLPLQDKTPLEPEQIEEVEEAFTFKPKKKEEKVVHIEEVEEVLKLPVVTEKKDYSITEETAEITVKKKVEEIDEIKITHKKKKPKVKEEEEETTSEFKISLDERKPEKAPQEKPEDVEETFALKISKSKKESTEVSETVDEVIKITAPKPEIKEVEAAEITIRKEVPVEKVPDEEDKPETTVIKRKKKLPERKKSDSPVEETFAIPVTKKKESSPEDVSVEEKFTVGIKKQEKKPVEITEETVKLTVEKERVSEYKTEEVAAEITVKKVVEETSKLEKNDEIEITKRLKIKKKIEPKPEDKPVEETFALPVKKKETVDEEVSVQEEFSVQLKEKEQKKEEKSAEESFKLVIPQEKPTPKEEVAAEEATVVLKPKEEPKRKPSLKEEVEDKATLKLKPKKKAPEKTPDEVQETFQIPVSKKIPDQPTEEQPVEEAFKVALRKKPKVVEEEEEAKIVIPSEKKEYKVTDISEEVTIKKIVEEKEEVVSLKKRTKMEHKKETVSEEFKILKKPEEDKKPIDEQETAEFKVGLPKKPKSKVISDEEDSLKLTIPVEKKPELVEENVEITVKKKAPVDVKKEVKEEEQKISIKKPKKKVEIEEEQVKESFTVSHKKSVEETKAVEDVEESFQFKTTPKKKPQFVSDEEESISISLPSEKPEYKTEEVSDETMVTLSRTDESEEEIVEIYETTEYVAISSYVSDKSDSLTLVEGERVQVLENTIQDWWFVRKLVTNERGYVPSSVLQDSATYTHYMKDTLSKKIEKLPVLRKPKPGEKMTAPKFVKKLPPMKVIDGQIAEISCQVTGNPRPTITWFKQTQIIKPSMEFQIFYDEDNVTTLIIREIFPEDAGTYTVVAKNAAGFASCSADLDVDTPFSDHGSETFPSSRLSLSRQSSLTDILEGIPPVFTEKPKDKKVDEGKPVELVCKVTGIPEPKITWLRNQKPLKESDRIEITTVTEDLDITKVIVIIKKSKVEDAGTYEIIAENREGKSVTSLILNVTEKPKKPKEEAPVFAQTYSDVICTEKDTVSLTVKIQGTPPPEVTWYKNGKELKPSKNVKPTVNKDVFILTLSDTKEGDTGEYKCVAKNPKGVVEHTAKITVQKTGVDFVEKLYDVEVKERETALFSIEVSHPTAQVSWHKDGEQVKPSDRIKFVEDDCTRKLVIDEANVNDEGEYTCVLGEKECTAELVVVELPPDFKGEMKDITVAKEQSAAFQVELTKGDARARWFKNDKEIDFSEHILLKIDGKRQKLIIYNASFEDAGTYTCVVGNKKRTAKLSVEAPTVEFTAKLPDKMTVPQDTDVSFTVQLSRPDVPVQWLKNGQPVPEKEKEKFQFVKEKNVYKMIVRSAQKDDAAEYSCVAGNVRTTTKLQVQEAHAEFTLKLRDVIVRESDTATLLVELTRETFEVRWMKDGQTLKSTDRLVMEKEGCRRRLIIKDTTLEDRGMYTCVLDEKITSSTLTVETTPRVVSEKRHYKGKRGGNVMVDVEFMALPQPKIEWLYKGKTVTADKKRSIENYGNKTVLTIKKVDDPDVGNYTLKLTNKCGECKTDFTVSIIDKPKPPGMPNASEIGNNCLTLSWKPPDSDGGSPIINYIIEYHDRNTLRWSTYNEKFTIDQPFTKVENLKEGEEYMFRTIAVNEVGKSDPSPGTKYILVREPRAGEPPAIVEHLKPVTCGMRKPAAMSCRISGQPPPTIKWLKNGKEVLVLKNVTTTYENQIATMQIAETTEKSAGTYTCKATNHLGTVETSSDLKIQELPTIEYDESMKNVRLKSFSEYVLNIKVFGYPSPELVWFKNGKVLESTKHTLLQVKEDSTTITIHSLENTDSATYTLQLTNTAGTVKYDFRLYVLDKPLPPEGPIAFHKIEKNSVTIGWQPPSIGGSEVMSYIIERCEIRRKVWIEVTTVKSDILIQEITDLSEGIEYAFRVIATNEYGRSDPLTSDPVAPKSLFDKPHAPKGPFTTSNMTENSFTLSWLAPDNDGGSPIIEYIVERKEASRKAWQRVATTDGKSLSMEVTGLKKDTAYHFRVCCRNDVGHSVYFSPEETITPGLKISPPSSPVGPLTILNMTNKTITLSWQPPANTGGAELTAYIIEKRESTKKAWNRLETLEPHVTSYTVHNLTHTKEYFFRVFAENPAGLSPPLETDKAIKLTSTAVRPSPPTGPLETVVTGPCSVILAWGRPETDGGSPILGYTVAMKNVRRIMWMEVGQVDGETQRLQIKDLQEGAEYMVRIMARNEVGISDPLEPEECVKVIRPPGFKESEKPEVDEKTISVSYSTETSSSWIREANVEPLLRSYTKHVLAGRNEYFFRIWHLAESMFK